MTTNVTTAKVQEAKPVKVEEKKYQNPKTNAIKALSAKDSGVTTFHEVLVEVRKQDLCQGGDAVTGVRTS